MVTFTREESRDIIIAVIALTILFSLSVTRPIGWSIENLLFYAPIAFVAVGIGFILHELGHKVVAQRFGFVSEFRRWDYGLILGFLTVPFGFMIFAPGAVYFGAYGRMVTNEENGKIALAGPVVNIILALIFLGLTLSIGPMLSTNHTYMMNIIVHTLVLGFNVNSYLALFNLLPIPPLDGSKVIQWNILVYIVAIAVAALLTFMSFNIVII